MIQKTGTISRRDRKMVFIKADCLANVSHFGAASGMTLKSLLRSRELWTCPTFLMAPPLCLFFEGAPYCSQVAKSAKWLSAQNWRQLLCLKLGEAMTGTCEISVLIPRQRNVTGYERGIKNEIGNSHRPEHQRAAVIKVTEENGRL